MPRPLHVDAKDERGPGEADHENVETRRDAHPHVKPEDKASHLRNPMLSDCRRGSIAAYTSPPVPSAVAAEDFTGRVAIVTGAARGLGRAPRRASTNVARWSP